MKITFKRTNFGAACLAAFLCMVIQSLILVMRDGGTLHQESMFFFMNYLEDKSLLKLVFDPFRNDWAFYQARELSYLFDLIDTHFVAFLLKKQIVWFHSISSLLLCGVMVFIQHYYTRKFFPRIPGITVTLISVFFVLSNAVTGLDYFRCAKYLTATGLWGALFAAYACCRYGSVRSKGALILSLLLMTLSDRQGFFFTAALGGSVGVLWLLNAKYRSRAVMERTRFVTLAALGTVIFGILNNLYMTPAIVQHLNGYEVDFGYQRDWEPSFSALKSGFFFLTGNVGNWFSNYTGSICIAGVTGTLLIAGLGVLLYLRFRKGEMSFFYLVPLWGCALGAMYVCAFTMVARHSLIMLPDVVYGTYAINFLVITLFLLTLTAAGGSSRFRKVLLALIAVGIVLRMGGEAVGNRFMPDQVSFSGINSRQHVLKEALRDTSYDENRHCIPLRMELFLKFYREHVLTKE